jgi:hypothetical protein
MAAILAIGVIYTLLWPNSRRNLDFTYAKQKNVGGSERRDLAVGDTWS